MSRAAVCMEPTNPLQHAYTMKITMTLADWQKLREQLNTNSWPGFELRDQIQQAVHRASEAFYPGKDHGEGK